MGPITAIYRYPVKSAAGEALPEVDVEPGGLRGDRRWACLDQTDGTIASLKHPHRWAGLHAVRASIPSGQDTVVHVGGRELLAGTAEADHALSTVLGRPVRLSRDVPADARLHRLLPDDAGMVPDWLAADPGQALVTGVAGGGDGRFVDFGAIHVVTTGALARLAAETGRDTVAAAPFRPNHVVDAPADPEPGAELRAGEVLLRVQLPTPRCIVPALDAAGQPTDRGLLAALARHHRQDLPRLGRAACFGVYAQVLSPGHVKVGQRLLAVS
ncbi:molybdenum cofactor biosysynthesis protein [Catellatospora sp. TT07R-123]|uniref:MOSC domain-containing protein n=1 Tax=Catellatospora sp. TT07R-123 TaxID=2733863 RepID=UPI001B0871C9|nr:MOSC N-terminal beta barrel domain-containing protein [Catellatospora sp. TT07R-123]GHJ48254.1 molybdenum cofactor biosysynthesis protein [Catellatospora sp. TT07R-123]